ncbi:MAG: PTS sugar transporter subunit IIA [Treponema sp.]|nr:PTS sugar transporter subunit IIA [Treponema sp.]
MLSSFISPACIKVGLESSEKEESFAELLEVLIANNPDLDRREAMNALITREEKMSTAVFPGVAVPHALCGSAKDTLVAVGISRFGIEFDAPEPNLDSANPAVNIIFEILFEEKDTETHLHVLRDILQLVRNPDFVKNILQAKSSQEVYNIIESLES